MFEGIIFDLDGVLVHTDRFHYIAWKKVAEPLGIVLDEAVNNRLRGVSRMESLEIILENYQGPALSDEEKVKLATQKNELYREYLSTMTPADVSPEVKDTLNTLKISGIKLAVGSSSKNAGYILERTGLTEFFDAVSDGNVITHSKPHPEVFLKAAEYIHCQPEKCLVVEDAVAGIEAAKAGGMFAAAIGDAQKCSKADYEIETFRNLLQIVQN